MTAETLIPDVLYSAGQLYTGMAVTHSAGIIDSVIPQEELPAGIPVRKISGFLSPGFVDIHTHGTFGVGYGEDTPERTAAAMQKLLRTGVTTLLPTMPSMTLEGIAAAIDLIAVLRGNPDLPHIPGVHLEGPYFAMEQRGAQVPEVLRRPDDGSIHTILERAEHISMVSYAPELPGAVELTRLLREHDIVAAAGHTNGTAEDLWACQEAGLSHVIHIYSGQSTITRRGPHRVPGMLEATLASDDLTVEIIADGKHLPDELMKIAYRALAGRLCAVSDSTPGAGMAEGEHYFMGPGEYIVSDGVGITMDGRSFGGSTTNLPDMLPILQKSLRLPIDKALAMLTDIPARAAHLETVGKIEAGYQADFVVLDADHHLTAVARAGKWLEPHRL